MRNCEMGYECVNETCWTCFNEKGLTLWVRPFNVSENKTCEKTPYLHRQGVSYITKNKCLLFLNNEVR